MIWIFLAAGVILLLLLIAQFTYRIAFHSPKHKRPSPYAPMRGRQYEAVADKMIAATKKMESIPFEAVQIQSDDGLRLHGRYYHVRDGAPLMIIFHGYRSSALRDSSGGHALSQKLKFNSLVIDERAHGESDGTVISFGIMERKDCLRWIAYANERFGSEMPILLSGLSMGAATVLMTADLDLPENVVCIMADSPYSSPRAIIRKVCKDRHYPVRISYPFVALGARIYGRFPLGGSSAVEAVKHAKIPILLFHGEDDRFVPCYMSEEIRNACASPVTLCTFPEAGHGLSYIIDPKRYEQAALDFLRTIPAIAHQIPEEL